MTRSDWLTVTWAVVHGSAAGFCSIGAGLSFREGGWLLGVPLFAVGLVAGVRMVYILSPPLPGEKKKGGTS